MLEEEKLLICYIFVIDKDLESPVIGLIQKGAFFKNLPIPHQPQPTFCIIYRNETVFKIGSSFLCYRLSVGCMYSDFHFLFSVFFSLCWFCYSVDHTVLYIIKILETLVLVILMS